MNAGSLYVSLVYAFPQWYISWLFLHYQEHKYHIFEQCESPKIAYPPKKQHIHTKYENEVFLSRHVNRLGQLLRGGDTVSLALRSGTSGHTGRGIARKTVAD